MFKKLTCFLLLLMGIIEVSAQSAYSVPNFRSADKETSTDESAISVDYITPIAGDENGYEISFRDAQNVNRAVEQYATSFKFYLSYKGKRVSDYKSANSNYKYKFTYKWYVWPNIVPKGDEKYVTAQIGMEIENRNCSGNTTIRKDRRDDSASAVY